MNATGNSEFGALGRLIQESRVDSFAPYFSERVLGRLAGQGALRGTDVFYEALRSLFLRASVAGLAAAVVLCVVNVLAFQDLGVATSWLDALFGLPSATLSDALTHSAL